MAIDVTVIGSLALATKAVVDAIKSLKDLFGSGGDTKTQGPLSELTSSFATYRKRIGQLSEQLVQTETLTRMLPIWLKEHSQFEIWEDAPSDERLKQLDSGLRQFISDSIHDHFSSLFFRTAFDKLPGVPKMLSDIRRELSDLETSLNAIPHSNLPAWRVHLPIIKVRLHDLRLHAFKLDSHAVNLRGELVKELTDSAN